MSDSEVGGGGPRVRPPQEADLFAPFGPLPKAAMLSASLWIEQALVPRRCDHEAVSECVRCQAVALARWLQRAILQLEIFAAQLADLRGARDAANVRHPPLDWTALLNRAAEAEQQVEGLRAERDALQQQLDELRTLFWLNHHCQTSALYGDDGEMQCNASHPNGEQHAIGPLDFKLDDVHRLASAICSMLRYEHQRANLAEADLAVLRSRGQALVQLIQEEIVTEDGGPTANYCWWCHQDVNGKDGPPEPHAQNCWLLRAKAACADALTAALKESK